MEEQAGYRKSLSKQINYLRDFIGVDEDKFKDFIKERRQKLKKEKGK